MSFRHLFQDLFRIAAVMSIAVTLGCTEPNPAFDRDPALADECRSGAEVSQTFSSFGRPEKLDVLFVIDTSGEVERLQEVFANAVSRFGELLRAANVDARLAVATTSASGMIELAGPSKRGPGCEENEGVVADLSRSDWGTVLRCNLLLGSVDEGFDMPLLVVDDLLSAGAGREFFRSDARLMVVTASMDDDCSSEDELTGNPRNGCAAAERDLVGVTDLVEGWIAPREAFDSVALVAFGGSPSSLTAPEGRPVCSGTIGSVRAANRLFGATRTIGEHGYFFSACTDEVVAPLALVVDDFVEESTVTLCLESTSVHEPLEVLGVADQDEDSIAHGSEGFVYLGSTERCPTGAIRFAGRALRGVDEVEIDYCTLDSSE